MQHRVEGHFKRTPSYPFQVPETKGKSLEEVEDYFREKYGREQERAKDLLLPRE